MKVLLLCGSPDKDGCTSFALSEAEKILNDQGIETERFDIGKDPVRGCIACGGCETKGKCVFDDIVNKVAACFETADGIIIGTPVYYAGSNGSLISLLDRLFYSTSFDKTMKVGACIASSRRAGSSSALDEVYKYFLIANMPIAPATYWCEIHGSCTEDVKKDTEGLQTVRNMARSMAFLIKSIALGKENFGLPEAEHGARTNFCDGL